MNEYFQVRETGNAGIAINDSVSHAMLISREDEMMMEGITILLAVDNPAGSQLLISDVIVSVLTP